MPTKEKIMLPMLQYLSDGKERSATELVEYIANYFALTTEDRRLVVPSGNKTRIRTRVGWATTYLKYAKLIDAPRIAHFKIAERGIELLKSKPTRIDTEFLLQFSEFVEFLQRTRKTEDKSNEPELDEQSVSWLPNVDYRNFASSIKFDDIPRLTLHSLKNPDMITVKEIISSVEKGHWVLPDFQRYYDWKKKNVREFLASIFNDYYVGSLLIWKVSKELELGFVPVSGVPRRDRDSDIHAIILDGQQRITSLYYAVRAPDNFFLKDCNRPQFFYIDFNSFFKSLGSSGWEHDSSQFIQVLPEKLSPNETFRKMLFPLYELERYSEWVKEYEDFMMTELHNDFKLMRPIRNAIQERLRHILEEFEIPYISLPETMTLSQVTDIFEGINSTGLVLGVFDLLIARLSKYKIQLKDEWDATIKEHKLIDSYYKVKGGIDNLPVYILQAIPLYYHETSACSRDDLLNIYSNIFEKKNVDFGKAWDDMADHVEQALENIENMKDGFGAIDRSSLPSASTIPILAALLKEISAANSESKSLEKIRLWYWSAAFVNAYSGAVDTQLTKDFKEMREWFRDESKIPKVIEEARQRFLTLSLRNISSKSNSIYKGVLSLIALRGARDFDTGRHLENSKDYKKDHVFPRAAFESEQSIDSILNITWMSDLTNRTIKRRATPKNYIPEFISKHSRAEEEFKEILSTHYINDIAFNFLREENFGAFIAEREKLILREIGMRIGIEPRVIEQRISNALITPRTPFSNQLAIYNSLRECKSYIYIFDKYFRAAGLEDLNYSVNKNEITEIKILMSRRTWNKELNSRFKDFKTEMHNIGIDCDLRILNDIKLEQRIHDRWIISQNVVFNVPSVDTIHSGNWSEIKRSEHRPPFEDWWNNSSPPNNNIS